jgi:hypothetical protein
MRCFKFVGKAGVRRFAALGMPTAGEKDGLNRAERFVRMRWEDEESDMDRKERRLMNMVAVAAMFPLALLLGACSPGPGTVAGPAGAHKRAATVAPPTPAQAAARMQQCRAKLEAGMPVGLVINASVDNGRPILWVGSAWEKRSAQDRESLARDAACFFLSGDESRTLKFSIYDQSTDREVAVWDHSRLIEW